MAVQAVLIVLLMFATTVKTVTGQATFFKKDVTLTCPQDGTWHMEDTKVQDTGYSFTFPYESQVKYRCEYAKGDDSTTTMKYYFYVKGKACDNCFELDAVFFLVIIFMDIIGTVVVMMIIYRCAKKKSSEVPPPSIKQAHPRPGHRAPQDQFSHYDSLNPNTRSETYSTVVNSGMLNRTG
ncbi:T-cell surface glycoprotein CD3 epsilon chain-like [Girardinichthys multiradiatus]|uniref:T-cell surface glycoprotein CD3 epsilon chain-like n=1 Tax=Girardinichthys multiradiatus TaxID=208333 RepID=UPI001FAB9FEF|nr:T-cell surface glycoprotein CD3 epsilon chain-like [Girardinichthys multiradiatus]